MDMDSLQYIDDYFNGLLTEEQKRQWEQKIHSDSVFAEEVAFYLSAGNLIKEDLVTEKKQRFRELYEQQKTEERTKEMTEEMTGQKTGGQFVRPMRKLRYYAVAAIVLFLAAGLWWIFLRQPAPQQLADDYISSNLQTLGVKMTGRPDSLQNALNAYNAGSFREALQQFEQIIHRDTANYTAKEFAGVVCLRLKDYDKALDYFRQLETYRHQYSNPALFYQSITLLKRALPGDTQKAKQLLQQVVNQDLEGKETAQQWLKNL
jgi:tetratricopeptide (TPR) repeat protein